MAKILGMLEQAQLENLTSIPAPGGPATPLGRIIMDVTHPLAAIPKVWDGSNWQTLGYAKTTSIYSQNSTQTCTVDWSLSLVQKVVLTGHAVIKFTNPQEGQVHSLTVVQAPRSFVNNTTYLYTFDMPDQDVTRDRLNYQPKPIPLGSERLHQWQYNSGAVAAYASVPTEWLGGSVPVTDTPDACDIMMDDKGSWLGLSTTTTPFGHGISLAQFLDNLGDPFGAQYAANTAAAAASLDMKYSPNGRFWASVGGTTPFIQTWYTLNGSSSGSVLSNPATLPTGAAKSVDFHPMSNFVTVGTGTTPFLATYPVAGGGYGTKLTDPATLPAGQVNGVRWSPHGDYLALALNASPFIAVYPFTINATTGVGAYGGKIGDPTTLPGAASLGTNHHQIAWRPQADFIAMCINTSPFVYLVPFNRATSTFGTPITFTALSGGSAATTVEWTPDGQYLIVGASSTPFCYVYDMSSGAPVICTLDVAAPNTGCVGMAMHPSGGWGAWITSSAPKVSTFIPPNKQRNYVRIV